MVLTNSLVIITALIIIDLIPIYEISNGRLSLYTVFV